MKTNQVNIKESIMNMMGLSEKERVAMANAKPAELHVFYCLKLINKQHVEVARAKKLIRSYNKQAGIKKFKTISEMKKGNPKLYEQFLREKREYGVTFKNFI